MQRHDFFWDKTSLKQDANWAHSCAPKGETPVLAVNARTRYEQVVLNIFFNVRSQ